MSNHQLTLTDKPDNIQEQFRSDVIEGLSAPHKKLPSKYFYDEKGDELFQQIMQCPEYYLTRCEMEIFRDKAREIAEAIEDSEGTLDIIELGAGDGSKTIHLLQYLLNQGRKIRYLPIDISGHILDVLENNLQQQLPDLEVIALEGEYFDMMAKAKQMSGHKKVVLFSGANIGNMTITEAQQFCTALHGYLQQGDYAVIGFDLKKDPNMIRAAYDDSQGITRAFNLNLLARINAQLQGNFDLNGFSHYCVYDPETGCCKSFLISLRNQTVQLAGQEIAFGKSEYIHTEVSQKYARQQISDMALRAGFRPGVQVADSNEWFVSAIWSV